MDSFGTERQRTCELAAQAARFARDAGDVTTAGELDSAASDLERGRLTVAVVGEFKRGKSSLLNALVEEPDLFPVDTIVATNLVTTLTYGECERIVVYLDKNPDGVEIARADISAYVTEQGNKGNRRGARLLEVELPSERLADGLTLVDTPGVGGLVKAHTEITYGFVVAADVVLFVSDALVGLSSEELAFIKRIGDHVRAMLFVVTKIDQSPDPDVAVSSARTKLAATLGRPGDELTIVPVSNVDKLAYLRSGDPEDLRESNFEALEDAVWGTLRRRGGALLLLRALGVVAGGLDRLLAPRVAELEALQASSAEEIERAAAGRRAAAARNKELSAESAGWRSRMAMQWELACGAMNERHTQRASDVRQAYTALLDTDLVLDQSDDIVNLVLADLTLLSQAGDDDLRDSLAAVAAGVTKDIGLSLNPAAPKSPIAITAGAPDLTKIRDTRVGGEQGWAFIRGGWTGGTLGATLGAIIGSVVPGLGTFVGAGIGAAIGGAVSARSSLAQMSEGTRTRRRMAIDGVIRQWLEASLQSIAAQRASLLTHAKHDLVGAFNATLKEEAARLKAQAEASDRACARTKEDAQARLAELSEPLKRMQSLRLATGRLASTVAERADGEGDGDGQPARLAQGPDMPPAAPALVAGADRGDWADD